MRIIKKVLLASIILMPFGASARTGKADFGIGIASYYANSFAGKRTASGEAFNPNDLTAAHRTARFGSHIRVTHMGSGKSVVVRVNDRGPFVRSRIIDLSYAAAKRIGLHHSGTARVSLSLVN